MASVCLYFQVHLPYRLRRYSVFDTGRDYWDLTKGAELCRRAAERSYGPAARVLLGTVREHGDRFRFGLSATGVALEQLRAHAPDVIAAFQELAGTGCVEFLAEPYHHSLSFLYSPDEFRAQVEAQAAVVRDLFGQTPRAFRNAELIYNNDLALVVAGLGFGVVLTEGADRVPGTRGPNHVYRPPGAAGPRLLLRNAGLSEDVASRFGDRMWPQWPVTADKFALWVDQVNGHGDVCNVFLDLATFGERQPAETGILDFLRHLPGELLRLPGGRNRFVTPSEAADAHEPASELDVSNLISWADAEQDLSAWLGNAMQSNALHELYRLEPQVKARGDADLLTDWRRLTSSDHFHYMSTKYRADGAVRRVFNPYESPYDSYINFMNVLDNVQSRLRQPAPVVAAPTVPVAAATVAPAAAEAEPAVETGETMEPSPAYGAAVDLTASEGSPAEAGPIDVASTGLTTEGVTPTGPRPAESSETAESASIEVARTQDVRTVDVPAEDAPVEPASAEPAAAGATADVLPTAMPPVDAPAAETPVWETVFVGGPAADEPPPDIQTEDHPVLDVAAVDDLPEPTAAQADRAARPAEGGG